MEGFGLIIFGLIKFIGYRLFLKFAAPNTNRVNLYIIALIRFVVGIAVGISIYSLLHTEGSYIPVYLSAILLARLLIWYGIFHLLFTVLELTTRLKLTIGGTIVSYLLDIPAMMGLWVTIGGIC